MAYRFDGTDDVVEFAITPFNGYVFGPLTFAVMLKRNAVSLNKMVAAITNSGTTARLGFEIRSGNTARLLCGGGFASSTQTFTSTSLWYLLVYTWAGGAAMPRFHVHDGTSWVHANAPSETVADLTAIAGTDRLKVGATGAAPWLDSDVAVAGLKKADTADATVETLSRTAFSAWAAFGFDWLIGFEASGTLNDLGSAGTGDEVSRNGTTLVSDPPGWSWTLATAPVANFSGTPLTGMAPENITFTDTSTNTPTGWAWDFGDGGTSTSQNPSHNYTVPGTYTVELVATNAAGSDTETKAGYVVISPYTEAIVYAEAGGITVG